jgi:DNA-directed RNA polymerase specialized sigma subunit
LPRRCCRPVGVGFFAVLPMASPASSLSRSALRARDALVLEHLPLADAIASAAARRLFPLVEREDLIQVAREALVRVPRRLHEQGQCPLRHLSLDASVDGEPCLLDQLAAPDPEPAISEAIHGLALEQLVDQLPAAQATALRLTVLEGLSLRAAAQKLEISAMSVRRAQKKAIAALRQQLEGGG